MIKSKEGAVKIKGSKSEISADFAMLCKGLIEENVLSPDDLHRLIEASQKADRLIEEIVENFIKSMNPSSVIEFAKKKKNKED